MKTLSDAAMSKNHDCTSAEAHAKLTTGLATNKFQAEEPQQESHLCQVQTLVGDKIISTSK